MISATLTAMTAAHGPRTTATRTPPTPCAVVPPGTGTLNIMIVKHRAEKIASSGMVRLSRTFWTRWVATAQTGSVSTPAPSEMTGLRYPSGMCIASPCPTRSSPMHTHRGRPWMQPDLLASSCNDKSKAVEAPGQGHPAATLYSGPMMIDRANQAAWDRVRERLHEEGMRWTPQRRTLVEVLSQTSGHVTGAEIVERCRELDPTTTPSTVYRTLDVLEDLGYVSHHHGIDGREEYHVLPIDAHGHLHCHACSGSWEIQPAEADAIAAMLVEGRAFHVDRSHITITGVCAACAD